MRDQRAALARGGAHSATLARDAPLRARITTARARRAILRSQVAPVYHLTILPSYHLTILPSDHLTI